MDIILSAYNTLLKALSYMALVVATSLGLVTPQHPPEIYTQQQSLISDSKIITPSPTIMFPSATPKSTFIHPTQKPTTRAGVTIKSTNRPSAVPTNKPMVQPTSTPRVVNPPVISISYPSENQSITMSASQQLCIADSPVGGNTNGIQRKHTINDSGWSSYLTLYTLCFDPKEGTNRVQFQYKNSFGDESPVYTRQFVFHRASQITVTVSGHLYEDANCNNSKDANEQSITVPAAVTIFKFPSWEEEGSTSSDSSGNFSYSKTMNEDESLQITINVVAPSGYKSNPHYTSPQPTLNNSQRSASFEIPFVPNANISACM